MTKKVFQNTIVDKSLPAFNTQPASFPNETWEEIPGFEDFYHISNYGRIKSLSRYIEVFIPKQGRSICYWTKEKIRKIKVHIKWNSIINKPYYECTVSLIQSPEEKTFLVSRLVYHCFIKPIDFEKDRLMIMHKDENGLNNYYKNLKAGFRSDVTQKSYNAKRHISPFALKSRKEMKQIHFKALLSRQKPIIQFSLEGKKLKVFPSIKGASLEVGISDSCIIRALKEKATSGGFRWKYFKK